jgi:hypothetical protein
MPAKKLWRKNGGLGKGEEKQIQTNDDATESNPDT